MGLESCIQTRLKIQMHALKNDSSINFRRSVEKGLCGFATDINIFCREKLKVKPSLLIVLEATELVLNQGDDYSGASDPPSTHCGMTSPF